MLKNSFKLLFLLSLMLGTFISISSSSWFSIWMGLEINLLSFIPISMKLNNSFSSEASLKYFLIQAFASSILLFTIIFLSIYEWLFFFSIKSMNLNLILISTLMLKSGVAPFHFWFPNVMEGFSWMMNFILMTWQKIAPLIIMSFSMHYFISIFIIISTIIGSLGGLNQTSLRKLMAYSSINHLAWMLTAMYNLENIWMFYFLFYSIISLSLILIFKNLSIFWMNQMYKNMNLKKSNKFIYFFSLLSLGGLPPFLGFLPKWLIIETFLIKKFLLILIFLILFSLITLFYYIRISFSSLLLNHKKMNFKNFNFFTKIFSHSFIIKKSLFSLIFNFLSIFGLLIFNFFYF